MKRILSSLPIVFMAGLAFLTSCKKADEVTPTAGKPTATVTFDKSFYGIQKNFDVSATVSTQGDSAYITIIADGDVAKPTGAIYMMYQKDSEKSVKFTKQPNGQIIPPAGYVGSKADGTGATAFNYAGADYTFNIPNSVNTSWKLTIPIKLRAASDNPVSDVFTIWVTKNGEKGRFDNPARGLAYGLATVTLNYTNEALISYYATTLGNSANDTVASCFATATGTNYERANANNVTIGTSIDFIYNNYKNPNLNANQWIFGSFYTSAGAVDTDANTGTKNFFGAVDKITNFTKVLEASTANWDAAIGATSLASEVDKVISSSTTSNKVVFTSDPNGKVFAFVTASGKKGLVKVGASSGGITSTTTDTDGEINIEVKVQR